MAGGLWKPQDNTPETNFGGNSGTADTAMERVGQNYSGQLKQVGGLGPGKGSPYDINENHAGGKTFGSEDIWNTPWQGQIQGSDVF